MCTRLPCYTLQAQVWCTTDWEEPLSVARGLVGASIDQTMSNITGKCVFKRGKYVLEGGKCVFEPGKVVK